MSEQATIQTEVPVEFFVNSTSIVNELELYAKQMVRDGDLKVDVCSQISQYATALRTVIASLNPKQELTPPTEAEGIPLDLGADDEDPIEENDGLIKVYEDVLIAAVGENPTNPAIPVRMYVDDLLPLTLVERDPEVTAFAVYSQTGDIAFLREIVYPGGYFLTQNLESGEQA